MCTLYCESVPGTAEVELVNEEDSVIKQSSAKVTKCLFIEETTHD